MNLRIFVQSTSLISIAAVVTMAVACGEPDEVPIPDAATPVTSVAPGTTELFEATETPSPPPSAGVQPGAVRLAVQSVCDDYSCISVDSLVVSPAKAEDPGGDYVFLDVTIENRSLAAMGYSTEDFTVLDADGNVYVPVAGAGKPALGSGTLAMGSRVSGEILYRVPPAAKLLMLDWCRSEPLPKCPGLGMSLLPQ